MDWLMAEAIRYRNASLPVTTHEAFIHAVKLLARAYAPEETRACLDQIKMVYGAGTSGLRGVTYYRRWKGGEEEPAPFVEVCAFGQESWVQLAGTTLHELGHVVAGFEAGHGKGWHDACKKLGLVSCLAAGTEYGEANFDGSLWQAILDLPRPNEGQPVSMLAGLPGGMPKPCTAGIGTRGGTSRGKGSGSRYRLYECECVPVIKLRTARDDLDATCNSCGCAFHKRD